MKIRRSTLLTLAVFTFIAALLIIFEVQPNFPDPDSFYHAKMATIVRDHGFIETFPWFQWTDLKNTYVNPHLLYHVFLIPFVTIFDPLIGMRVSAAVFGLLAFLAIYLTVRFLKIPHPWIFPLLAALSPGFLFRMSLPRAPALSVAILLAATWAMLENRTKTLFFISFFFVWFYHGWPIIFLSLGALFVATLIANAINHQDTKWRLFKKTVNQQKGNIIATTTGILAGLVINPYFPQNILFSVLDIFKIGIVNYQSILSVGQEWFPASVGDIILSNLPALLAVGLGLAFFIPGLVVEKKLPTVKQMTMVFTFLFLAGGYSLLCLKANRYKEYATPFIVLEAAVLFPYARAFWLSKIWPEVQIALKKSGWQKTITYLLVFVIIGGLAAGAVKTVVKTADHYRAEQYQIATDWIKSNVPSQETIFHNCWDFSLILWYLDDTHYYLVGLDPTFMYDYDPINYKLWERLTLGEEKDVEKIKSVFQSRVVVIDKRQGTADELAKNLTDSSLFEKVVENKWVEVYADPTL